MWGREMRAGLVFVLASLLAGGAFREWKRTHEPRFADLVADLQSAARNRGSPVAAASDSFHVQAGDPHQGGPQPERGGRGLAWPLIPAKVDLNHSTAPELERLPGIGPALAARIVADRESRGPYGSPESLLRVPGIGPRILARLRPYLAAPTGTADSGSPIAN